MSASEHVGCLRADGSYKRWSFVRRGPAKAMAKEESRLFKNKLGVYRCPTCNMYHLTRK